MALPLTANTTCDIYRNANAPPAAPDVAGVSIFLSPDWATSHRGAAVSAAQTASRWTHVALMPPTTDVRDAYDPGGAGAPPPGSFGYDNYLGNGQDHIWIPDQNGTRFDVIFVERIGLGTATDAKRVYLQRQRPTWPSNNL